MGKDHERNRKLARTRRTFILQGFKMTVFYLKYLVAFYAFRSFSKLPVDILQENKGNLKSYDDKLNVILIHFNANAIDDKLHVTY